MGKGAAGAICKPELTPTSSHYTAGSATSCSFPRPLPLTGLPNTHAEPWFPRERMDSEQFSLVIMGANLTSDCLGPNPSSTTP